MSSPEQTPPPVGEEIHLPGPSLLPILNAAGLTLAIIGITLGWVLIAVGLALFLVTTVKWIASTRRDIAELPPEHSSHH
jgi:hypothetical protein